MWIKDLLSSLLLTMNFTIAKLSYREIKDKHEDILLVEGLKEGKLKNLMSVENFHRLRNLKTQKKHKVIRKAYVNEEEEAIWTEYSECGDSCIEGLCPYTNE